MEGGSSQGCLLACYAILTSRVKRINPWDQALYGTVVYAASMLHKTTHLHARRLSTNYQRTRQSVRQTQADRRSCQSLPSGLSAVCLCATRLGLMLLVPSLLRSLYSNTGPNNVEFMHFHQRLGLQNRPVTFTLAMCYVGRRRNLREGLAATVRNNYERLS